MTTYDKVIALLDAQQARYRVVEHEAIGQTEVISAIRGNDLQQAAKAMVLEVTMPDRAALSAGDRTRRLQNQLQARRACHWR